MKQFIFKFILNYTTPWMLEEVFLFKNGQWLALLLGLLIALVLMYSVRLVIYFYARQKALNQQLFSSTLPFGLLVFGITLESTLLLLQFTSLQFSKDDYEIFKTFFRITNAFVAVWSSIALVDLIFYRYISFASLSKNKFDNILAPMVKKVSKLAVITVGTLYIAHHLNFDVRSLIAGLGIGGVAIALAAKHTISNLFGSLTVLIDRPFYIGDYVVLDKNIEGVVENVGFRSTRVRTPNQSLVTIPNSNLQNMAIDNMGLRKFRRFRSQLQLTHQTNPVHLDDFVVKIKDYFSTVDGVENKEMEIQVYLNEIQEFSVQLIVNLYLNVKDGKEELELRHLLNRKIIELAHDSKVIMRQHPN